MRHRCQVIRHTKGNENVTLNLFQGLKRCRNKFGMTIFAVLLVAPIFIPQTPAPGYDKRFITVRFPSGTKIEAEVADTPEKRSLGLMFRKGLGPDHGMIFIFSDPDYHRFWMKDCFFEIDIIWLDEKKRIVHHEESLPPCKEDPCPSYGPPAKALYVIEMVGGFFKKMGLKNGMRVEFKATNS